MEGPGKGLPGVSVVMPTYRRKDGLRAVLEPLLRDPCLVEAVVVVDGCRDGSFEMLRSAAESDCRIKPVFVPNGGPSAARQAGVEVASGDVILLMDDDVIAAAGLVTGHAVHHAGEDGLVVVGYMPIRLPAKRDPGDVATYLYSSEYEAIMTRYERDHATVLTDLWGGNVSLPRSDCLRVGVLSPECPRLRRHDDQEFGFRLMKAGMTGRFDRSLLARHRHSRSVDAFLNDSRAEAAERVLIHRLHPDVIGPLDRDFAQQGLPRAVRSLVRTSGNSKAAHRVVGALGRALIRASGELHSFGMQTRATQFIRRVEQQRAMADLGTNAA